MSFSFSTRSRQTVVGRVSKLAVGSVMVVTMMGSPAATYAQAESSEPALNTPTEEPFLTQLSFPTIEEKISWVDAAVLSLDSALNGANDNYRMNTLRALARSYSELGEQARAVQLLDRAVAIAQESQSGYPEAVKTVPTYIQIGEIEAAEALIAQVVDSSAYRRAEPLTYMQTEYLMEVAEAYSATGNTDLAMATLSLAIEHLERMAAQEASVVSIHNTALIAQAYEQVVDKTAAEDGLSRLAALIEAEIELYGADPGYLIVASSQLSIVESQRGNAAEAEALAATAMEIVMGNQNTGGSMGKVATAYGYIEDRDVAERALAEMTQLVTRELSSDNWMGPLVALRGIAIAYDKIGNTTKSDEALAVITDQFDDLHRLEAVLRIYTEMENPSAQQEAIIQQMFDKLPLLRESELIASEGTARIAGINSLVEGYVHTADVVRAQERLAMLESFFKEVPFDPLGTPGQLVTLAHAAARREDDDSAQRLLVEATELLAENGCQEQCVNVLIKLSRGYTVLEDDRVKQAGFDRLQQIADETLDAEIRERVRNLIIRDRAML